MQSQTMKDIANLYNISSSKLTGSLDKILDCHEKQPIQINSPLQ